MQTDRPASIATVLTSVALVVVGGLSLALGRADRAEAFHDGEVTGDAVATPTPDSGDAGVPTPDSGDRTVAGASAETRATIEGECPVLTDSIRRLYLGFLEREPTSFEFKRDIDRYRSGEANLEGLASTLASSGLFRTRYGALSNQGFVERVYSNTLRRPPSEGDTHHWITTLSEGYPRGAVMLAFTESADFVERTGTARPLSGYLNWYPEGVHWYCGVGSRDKLPIADLAGEHVYADYLITNHGDGSGHTTVTTTTRGLPRLAMVDTTVPSGYTDFRWHGQFSGARHYGDGLDVRADQKTSWVVVFYSIPIGSQRLGWQIPR